MSDIFPFFLMSGQDSEEVGGMSGGQEVGQDGRRKP